MSHNYRRRSLSTSADGLIRNSGYWNADRRHALVCRCPDYPFGIRRAVMVSFSPQAENHAKRSKRKGGPPTSKRKSFSSHETSGRKAKRKLSKSVTNKKLAGVAGGLGEYFGVDPTLIRIGFVIATHFLEVDFQPSPLYIVLALDHVESGQEKEAEGHRRSYSRNQGTIQVTSNEQATGKINVRRKETGRSLRRHSRILRYRSNAGSRRICRAYACVCGIPRASSPTSFSH